jgi:hypothetical protein
MPPPQRLLASRLRGFVCRLCLSKLQVPVGQRQPWLSRNIANDNGPPKSKGESPWFTYLPEPLAKYFERDPGGDTEPPDDEAFMESLEQSIRDLEEATGRSRQELAAEAQLVDLKDLADDGELTEAEETSRSSERPALAEEYVEQTSNGERTEIIDDPEDATFMEVLEESLRELEEKTGKSWEDLAAELNSMDPEDLAGLMQREKTIQSSRRQAPTIPAPTIPAPTINFFEQDADGNRTEITDSFGDAALMNHLEGSIVKMKKRTGKSRDELAAEVGFEDIERKLGELRSRPEENAEITAKETLRIIKSQTQELEAQLQEIEKIPDLKNISEKDRLRLRRVLLGPAADGRNVDLENYGSLLTLHADKSSLRQPVSKISSSKSDKTSIREVQRSRPIPNPKPHHHALVDANIDLRDFPIAYHGHIGDLLSTLRLHFGWRGTKNPPAKPPVKVLWRHYLLARNGLLSAPSKIPSGTWESLWQAFDQDDSGRMAHIKALGDDMSKAGISFQPAQRLLYIEAMVAEGHFQSAVKEWEEAKPSLADGKHCKEFWAVGVRSLSGDDQPDQALETAKVLLQSTQDPTGFRILLPIIQAYLGHKDGKTFQRAWALYIRLRSNLGANMTMEDYDALVAMFMAANQSDLALGVFVDMMLTGDQSVTRHDSTAQYKATVGSTHNLNSLEIQESELNWEEPRILTQLPRKFRNKFFFGSWVKKLIGEEQLDAAKKVFDLMQELSIEPSPTYFNGLLGAWYRQGTERYRVLAEELAWKMIKIRLERVRERDNIPKVQSPLRIEISQNLPDSRPVSFLPAATIETFSILIQQYRQRRKSSLVTNLFDVLREAKLQPNTFFMNQLLLTDLKGKKRTWLWDTYCWMINSQVHPDMQTYSILWTLMKMSHDPAVSKLDKQYPKFATCRNLFAEMIKHIPATSETNPFPRELYELIILSFSLAEDQAGTAVALRALQRYYNIYPSEETARAIVLQLARLGFADEAGLKPKRLNISSLVTNERITQVTKILGAFKTHRAEALLQHGIVFDQLQGEERLEETLLLLSDLLRYATQARLSGEERHNYNAALASKAAAEQMNAPECAWTPHSVVIGAAQGG